MESMPMPQNFKKEDSTRLSPEMEGRTRNIVSTMMREIKIIARMPGKGIDESGMEKAAQKFQSGLEMNKMVNWNDVFSRASEEVEKEIELLKQEGAGQDVIEKIVRTRAAWQYLAKKVLNREYVPSQET